MFKALSDNVSSFFSAEKSDISKGADRAKNATATPPPSPADWQESPSNATPDESNKKSPPTPESLTTQLNAAKVSEEASEVESSKTAESIEDVVPAPTESPIEAQGAPEKGSEERPKELEETSGDKSTGDAFEDAAEKAYSAAKEWGSYFVKMTKAASKSVTQTASVLKKSVEDKTIIGEFAKEQDKFVSEKRQRDLRSDAAVPPWVGYHEEETMKEQILSLSSDLRNFLRNPPAGVQFEFNFETSFPVAMATLKEDPRLKEMRFEIVPKRVSEHDFWRNYFYRVSLIKQSTQLSLLAQESGGNRMEGSTSSLGPQDTTGSQSSSKAPSVGEPVTSAVTSPGQEEFASDDYHADVNDEDLKKEMESLRLQEKAPASPEKDTVADWERELQEELNEFEVVDGEIVDGDFDDDELEREILQQIDTNPTS